MSSVPDWRKVSTEHVPAERPDYDAMASMILPLHMYPQDYGWQCDALCASSPEN